MEIDQVTYGSVNRSRMKGYQVIGKSSGVDAAMASAFCKWAPSHNSLEVGDDQSPREAWALSFFPLLDDHFAVARSVHGGPEYSGRGGLAVMTSALVLSRKQMANLAFDAIGVSRTALTFGHLILQSGFDEALPEITLPSQLLNLPTPQTDFVDAGDPVLPSHAVQWIARESCSLLRDGRKVMIVGACNPLPILSLLFEQLKSAERREVSFSCGLKSSSRRDFRVQFTSQTMSLKLQRELDRGGIVAIDVARVLIETE
ncbi:MAG: hypothetical protein AAFX06_31595 [Planctomycetota bacterium]